MAACDGLISSYEDVFDTSSTVKMAPIPIVVIKDNAIPVWCPTRYRSSEDKIFINQEVSKLIGDGVIKPSNSPWRSQLVVAKASSGKKRMVVDYSTTVNKFTVPDAFPIPLIEEVLASMSNWSYFSAIDLKVLIIK